MSVPMTDQQTTDFFLAIEEGDADSVLKMLDSGMSPNVMDDYRMSALFLALGAYRVKAFTSSRTANSEAIVRALLDAGADPDSLGEHFHIKREHGALLNYACSYRMTRMVTLLLERGASPAISSTLGNAAHHLLWCNLSGPAGSQQFVENTLKQLFKAGLLPNSRDLSGNTLLWYAFRTHALVSTFALLLDHGVDLRPTLRCGYQAIHMASLWGRADVLRLLVSRGVDVDMVDATGGTALYYAHDVETVQTLLELRSRLDHVDHDGRNAFHSMVAEQLNSAPRKDVLLYLLNEGIDVRQRDQTAQTALELVEDLASRGNCTASEVRHAIASLERRAVMRTLIAATPA